MSNTKNNVIPSIKKEKEKKKTKQKTSKKSLKKEKNKKEKTIIIERNKSL